MSGEHLHKQNISCKRKSNQS